MDRQQFASPDNTFRPYVLLHSHPENFAENLDFYKEKGFGGLVTNASWHREEGDEKQYLGEEADFAFLDRILETAKDKDLGVWLYDEKGYPSASADGLTLLGHPEYEARGVAEIETDGGYFMRNDLWEQIVFACKKDGTPVPYDKDSATGAELVYAVRPVFEGSHAQKCGWGPRRYPNLLDKQAIAAFLRNTYDTYYQNTKRFGDFEAVFTDEPSLMAAYVNCYRPMPYRFIPWQNELPARYKEAYGEEIFPLLPQIFSREDAFKPAKLHFWRLVAEMMNEAYFAQIENWCASRHIRFSGHALLEENITWHTPLYGDLVKQLKTFDYPGADMLTGDPKTFRHTPDNQFFMAAKYVGSATRMTGKTDKVMVEICPIQRGNEDYTLEQEIGTMDLLFMCGINHINSYLRPPRLGDGFRTYTDYFARAAYVLRGAKWNGSVGLYYPIETLQGFYRPEHLGVNTGAVVSDTENTVLRAVFDAHNAVVEHQLDDTVVDADWLRKASLANGKFSANGLTIDTLILPAVRFLDDDILEKLAAFEKSGGKLLWFAAKPAAVTAPLCEDLPAALADVKTGLTVTASDMSDLLVSPLVKDGKRLWYVINSTDRENTVTLSVDDGAPFTVWHNLTGLITEEQTLVMKPYTSVFVVES